jgi:hypothetical protein
MLQRLHDCLSRGDALAGVVQFREFSLGGKVFHFFGPPLANLCFIHYYFRLEKGARPL